MIRKMSILLMLSVVVSACTGSSDSSKLDLAYFLDELTCTEMLPEFPAVPYKAAQVSSYDRASKTPGTLEWFANFDGFGVERVDTVSGRIEKVLFNHTGPGVITRFWMTTRSPGGTMRFYFDGQSEPGWVIPAFDLTEIGVPHLGGLLCPHTSYVKGVSGGSTLFLPIPYAESCRITFEEPEGWSGVPRYYHINYRAYPQETEIETFSAESVRKHQSKIKKVGCSIGSMPQKKGKRVTAGQEIAGDGAKMHLCLEASSRGSAVRGLSFHVSAADTGVLARIMDGLIVKITSDGIQCVDVPLSFLAGAGLEAYEVRSRHVSCDANGKVHIAYPMPFRDDMEICIVNHSGMPADVSLEANVSDYRFTDNTLYFKAAFKEAVGLEMSNHIHENVDWNFTTITGGRGVYVADVLSMYNHSRAWYGEGDEKIFVDNEAFPSHFGTGTEDYYNSSWAPVIPFHTAFGGAPRADLPSSAGYNTFFRSRGLDVIPFNESLRFDLELIAWMRGRIDYYNSVFFYGDPETVTDSAPRFPFTCDYLENPVDPSEYHIEGAYELEDIRPVAKTSTLQVDVQPMAAFPDGNWSRAKQMIYTGGHPGDWVEYKFKVKESGNYDLHVFVTKAGDYGKMLVSAGGKSVEYDAFGIGVTNGEVILKDIAVDGSVDLRIEITGKNQASSGYMLGIDCMTLSKTQL